MNALVVSLSMLLSADGGVRGDLRGAFGAAAQDAQALKRAQAEAEKVCKPLETQPVPLELEQAVGKRIVADLQKRGAPVEGPLRDYVQGVASKLGKLASRPLPWTVMILEVEGVKSGAVPGGTLLLSKGLLARLGNEAQLAAVLAHEIAHLELDAPSKLSKGNSCVCSAKRMMKPAKKEHLPAGVEPAQVEAAMLQAAELQCYQVFIAPFGNHSDEYAADESVGPLLQKAGYAPAEWKRVLESAPPEDFFHQMPTAASRLAKLATLPATGKAPAFPKSAAWPNAALLAQLAVHQHVHRGEDLGQPRVVRAALQAFGLHPLVAEVDGE
jgi:predicted Zn-dependent protease